MSMEVYVFASFYFDSTVKTLYSEKLCTTIDKKQPRRAVFILRAAVANGIFGRVAWRHYDRALLGGLRRHRGRCGRVCAWRRRGLCRDHSAIGQRRGEVEIRWV